MFNPSRDQVRQFFFDTWQRHRAGQPLEGLQHSALAVILLHPEYQPVLDAPERYLQHDWTPEQGSVNPFLHMSLHLAIEEQLSIDQPPGVLAEIDRLSHATGDRHAALHAALECLGEVMWLAQRDQAAPDQQAYLEGLRRR